MKEVVKGILNAIGTALDNIPIGRLIKIAVGAGVALFTAWVLIKHTKKLREEAKRQEEMTEYGINYSPVDEILNNGEMNYVTNPKAFDEMDPVAKELCKKLRTTKKKKKKHKAASNAIKEEKKEEKSSIVSLFDDFIERRDESNRRYNEESEKRKIRMKEMSESIAKKGGIKNIRLRNNAHLKNAWKEFGSSNADRLRRIAHEVGLDIPEDDTYNPFTDNHDADAAKNTADAKTEKPEADSLIDDIREEGSVLF